MSVVVRGGGTPDEHPDSPRSNLRHIITLWCHFTGQCRLVQARNWAYLSPQVSHNRSVKPICSLTEVRSTFLEAILPTMGQDGHVKPVRTNQRGMGDIVVIESGETLRRAN